MPSSTINKELSHIFEEMALMYEMQEDRFRSRAYHRGSQTLETLAESVSDILAREGFAGLKKLPGIGRAMAEKIQEYSTSGAVKAYDKMKRVLPVDLEELTAIEGLGPKMAQRLYKELKIKNIKDLERALHDHKVQALEGFGRRREENLLAGIAFVASNEGRMLLGDVLPYAHSLIREIEEIPGVTRASIAGSLRRRRETIGDVDILVATENSKKVFDYIAGLPEVVKVWGRGPTKVSVHTRGGFDIDIRVVPTTSYGAALQYFTGSKAHNIALRKIAISQKYKLNEYGLFSTRGRSASGGHGKKNVISGGDEATLYKKLGLDYIEPELRSDSGEIEAARKGKLPHLIAYDSLRGDLQIQTDWTDGKNSIEEMAFEARRIGHEYIAITDHTRSLAMTGGSDEKKLLKQKREIARLNKKIKGITILSGAEVNIMKDGTLDIDDETLAQLDVVGISVHSHFNMSRRDMTERIIRAMGNPHADILFHPTGRIINKRPAYEVDMGRIIREAAGTGTILEINAFPSRLDLKDEHIRMAVEAGVKMCINTDAHATRHLKFLEYGIAQARRGWASKKDIINTLPLKKFLSFLKK